MPRSRRSHRLFMALAALTAAGVAASEGCIGTGSVNPGASTDGSVAFDGASSGPGPVGGGPPVDGAGDAPPPSVTVPAEGGGSPVDGSAGSGDAAPEAGGAVDGSADADASDAGVDGAVATPAPDYLWYVMDETQGTTAHDSSSNRFDITNLTGVTWNQGAVFDGVSGCGTTTLTSAYRTPPMTLSAWMKPAARTDSPTSYALQPYPPNALSDDIPGVGGYGLGLNVWSNGSALAAEGVDTCTQAGLCVASSTQNAATDGGGSCVSAASCQQGFVADKEYFVVVTMGPAPTDGGALVRGRVYVNGALFDDSTAYIPAPSASPPLYLGCHNNDTGYGTTRFFSGRLRDVRVYLRELGPTEVTQLYNNGPTLQAPTARDAGPG